MTFDFAENREPDLFGEKRRNETICRYVIEINAEGEVYFNKQASRNHGDIRI